MLQSGCLQRGHLVGQHDRRTSGKLERLAEAASQAARMIHRVGRLQVIRFADIRRQNCPRSAVRKPEGDSETGPGCQSFSLTRS